jgi:SpoVK/Ycf46/Vps4 family AAA+-type ATPase
MNRGKVYKEYALGQHYLTYRGVLVWRGWNVWKVKADGRCMIDIKTFSHMNPNSNFDRPGDKEEEVQDIPDKDLWLTWPTLAGFSFTAKQWGEFVITSLTPVIFDDKAYELLVLPQKKKELIKALVEFQSTTFTDIITGKGGGCIFLLHGSPGVGKTLTAESIAELLHRPLYSVSVGELGTTTDTLEKNLKDILQVAATWNAVVLIDEADIFLEKRTKRDVQRNALVGIFLRLLEYHQGVLFLTTNRVKTFDPAFHSRISIALKYKDLELDERSQVWHNLLQAAGIKHIKADSLVQYDLNGRQIKNCIRLAQALAKSQSTETSMAHILETIKAAEQFKDDIKAIDEKRKLKHSSNTII